MRNLVAPLSILALLGLVALPLARAEDAPDLVLEDPSDPVAVIETSMGKVYVELFAKETPKTVENFLGLAEGTREWKDAKTGATVTRPYYDGLGFHRVIADFMIQGGCPLGTGQGDPGYKFDDEIDAKALGLDKIMAVDTSDSQGPRPHAWLLIRSQQDFFRTITGPLFQQMGITTPEQARAREAEIKERVSKLTLLDVYQNLGYRYLETGKSHRPVEGVLAMANSGANTNGSQFFLTLKDTDWLTGKHTVFGKVVHGMDVVRAIGKVKTDETSRPLEEVKILSIRRLAR